MLAVIAAWFKLRTSREARFFARYDKKFESLEAEVAECRKRDARIMVVETCFRLTVPELQRLDPTNLTLRQVAALMLSLPTPENEGEWLEFVTRLDEADKGQSS